VTTILISEPASCRCRHPNRGGGLARDARGWQPQAVARDGGSLHLHRPQDKDGSCPSRAGSAANRDLMGSSPQDRFLVIVAWVAEKLAFRAFPMRRRCGQRTNASCARRSTPTSAQPALRLLAGCRRTGVPPPARHELSLVVKPVDNMGARGVRRVENHVQLADACREALPLSRSSRVIIEEYMEGPDSASTRSFPGARSPSAASRTGSSGFHRLLSRRDTPCPRGRPEDRSGPGIGLSSRIAAIGIDNGRQRRHKVDTERTNVGEIAARLSAVTCRDGLTPASGVEVTEAALNIASTAAGRPDPAAAIVCAERALISIRAS